ncbi:hypothetical protein QJS66_18885 [Kocuria rhizophila]|nr:hypothetical protein QJS66_18885 [Kocuria rhizophila]
MATTAILPPARVGASGWSVEPPRRLGGKLVPERTSRVLRVRDDALRRLQPGGHAGHLPGHPAATDATTFAGRLASTAGGIKVTNARRRVPGDPRGGAATSP